MTIEPLPTPSTLTIETRGGVAIVRLSHGKVNAFDVELLREWMAALEALENGEPSAVVVTGLGTTFSAGVDLRRLTRGGADYIQEFLPLLTDAFLRTFSFPKPLIAAVNGHAVAGGCILACACDYRVMAHGAGRIGTPELSVGVPFPSAAMEILRLTVPSHRLQALIYGGLTCSPDQALTNGFVDELASAESLIDRTVEIAARLGSLPHATFALTKKLVRQPSRERIEASSRSVDQQVLEAWLSPAVQDAIRAYTDRTLKK